METPPPTPPMPANPPSPKKGLHPMAWVGMGCGGLLVVGVIGVALVVGWGKRQIENFGEEFASSTYESAAEVMVEMHPDLEMIAEDPQTGEITVIVTSTGEELSFDPDDLAQGLVTIKGSDGAEIILGQGDLTEVPVWVPRYAGAVDERALFHRVSADGTKGLLNFTSTDAPALLESFYDKELSHFSSSGSSSFDLGSVQQKTLTYSEGDQTLEITIVVPGAGQSAQVTVSYEESSAVAP